jgi:hypothetical protein
VLLLVKVVFRFLRHRDDKVETCGVAGMLEASTLKTVFLYKTPRDPPHFHGVLDLFATVVVGALATARIWVERISLVWHFWLAWSPIFL